MDRLRDLSRVLTPFGLMTLGHCPLVPDDDLGTGTLVLVGPNEPDFWHLFIKSAEYRDNGANPLDRWSQRVLDEIGEGSHSQTLYPFGGPPYRPFYSWALRTGRFWASPIGFLVHDTAGLFAAFRGALLIPEVIEANPTTKPCDSCPDTPCASACPVDAFADGYDVTACKSYLASSAGTDCMTKSCGARRACPIGKGNRLPEQAAFHMKAFL